MRLELFVCLDRALDGAVLQLADGLLLHGQFIFEGFALFGACVEVLFRDLV